MLSILSGVWCDGKACLAPGNTYQVLTHWFGRISARPLAFVCAVLIIARLAGEARERVQRGESDTGDLPDR